MNDVELDHHAHRCCQINMNWLTDKKPEAERNEKVTTRFFHNHQEDKSASYCEQGQSLSKELWSYHSLDVEWLSTWNLWYRFNLVFIP